MTNFVQKNEMENILMISLIISLCTVGIYAATWRQMILHKSAQWMKRFPIWIYKPVCGCLICMSSVYSILFWLIFRPFTIYYLPVVILMVAGTNTMITATIAQIIPDENEE